MTDLDVAAQPHCPECDVIMHDIEGGYQCPSCGHIELVEDVEARPGFEGPSIRGG